MSDFRFWKSVPQAIEVCPLVDHTGPIKNKRQSMAAVRPANPLHKIPQVGVNPALRNPEDLRVNPNIHTYLIVFSILGGY
jgi:hypothetical protein